MTGDSSSSDDEYLSAGGEEELGEVESEEEHSCSSCFSI